MKHFVFFIGGTGARVLTSFLHICASGMVRMDDTVRLMMLDADTENGACRNAMGLYRIYHTNHAKFHAQEVKRALGMDVCQAFYTDLELPDTVITPVNTNTATLDLATADRGGKKALEWFYTKDEREQNLSRGFYAHPNIGCIYFQDLDKRLSNYTRQIRDAVSRGEDTRVVIVGSMFGGTGAAGTPSVLKLIHRACMDGGLTPEQVRQRLHFCGVLVTPYFKVVDVLDRKDASGGGNLHINSNTFFNNTQAALNYYGFRFAEDFENIYLVGQNGLQLVNSKYVDGGTAQENKPHVVELIAAMSVKNFLQQTERGTGDLQVYSQILDVEARKPIFGWDTLDPDLGYMADMLRTQALLKVTFGPYTDNPRGFGKPTWYKAFRMDRSGRKEELSSLMQYTDIFLEWLYNIQYQLTDDGYGTMVRDNRIALVSPLIGELGTNSDLRQDVLFAGFPELLDDITNPQNISYRYTNAKQIVVNVGALGTADRVLPGLGSLGLYIEILRQTSLRV